MIGYARTVVRDGHLQLTEFFVSPDHQSAGVGRELITRAFQTEGTTSRSIMATTDMRAQGLYLKMGMLPRFPVYYFGRKPRPMTVLTDLVIEPMTASPETLEILARLDREIVNFRRDVDHTWLASERQGYLYIRNGEPVGYGYVGLTNGPFALRDSADYPTVLAHAESQAAAQGYEEFGLEVPLVNQTAVNFLSGQGFKPDTFVAIFMSDAPSGKFENYIVTSPAVYAVGVQGSKVAELQGRKCNLATLLLCDPATLFTQTKARARTCQRPPGHGR